MPHWKSGKSAQVLGEHGGRQTPLALQTCPVAHVPHGIVWPVHTLVSEPQFCPSATHSSGVGAALHWFATPSTPQP